MPIRIIAPLCISMTLIIAIFLFFPQFEFYCSKVLAKAEANRFYYSIYSFLILTSDILLPIPSSVIMYSNGLILGAFNGFLLSIASLLSSSLIGYYIGLLTRYGRKPKSITSANELLHKREDLAIIITRGIPILSESICIVCGYNKMPVGRYLRLTILGLIPVALVYSICGSMASSKNTFILSFCASILIAGVFWFAGRKITTSRSTTQ